MAWHIYVAYFFGGAFLTNAIPHFVSGLMGKPFQSPFASRRDKASRPQPSMCCGAFSIS